jgi:hypothetical protein
MDSIPRKKLADIVNGGREKLEAAFSAATPAGEFTPLPAGVYVARIVSGALDQSKKGTPEYCITFKVLEGEHAGRQVWHRVYLTAAAMPMAKRDLAKLGITSLDQLERPLPVGLRCNLKLTLRKGDDGAEYNRVKTFEVTGIDKVEDDDFAPTAAAENTTPQAEMFAPAEAATRWAQVGGK